MTDAALPVTERTVEQFAEAYLTSLDASIEKQGRRWVVSLHPDADTELELDDAVMEISSDPDSVNEDAFAIAPESPFVERMLDEAADRTPFGSLALTTDQYDIELPLWLTEGDAEITEFTFTPYYDRRALCVLFHIGIETVSEYQTEELHAVAIDLNSYEPRPRLAETYLELTDDDYPDLPERTSPDEQKLENALETARTTLEGEISPKIVEIRERATHSAEVELTEYRQFTEQRRDELEDEIDHLSTRIDEVTETIDSASDQHERVEALRKRKELRTELEDLRDELEDLTTRIERGFPKKRREIRDRHSLIVRIRPVAATAVTYERGDLDVTLRTSSGSTTISYAFAVGTGVIEDASCGRCGRQLTSDNVLTIDGSQIVGSVCCGK